MRVLCGILLIGATWGNVAHAQALPPAAPPDPPPNEPAPSPGPALPPLPPDPPPNEPAPSPGPSLPPLPPEPQRVPDGAPLPASPAPTAVPQPQPPYPPYPPRVPYEPIGFQRDGFIIGFAVGGGSYSCDDCETLSGPSLAFSIGGMITPSIALMFEGWVVAHADGDTTQSQTHGVIAGRFFLARRFWLQAGLGAGQFSIDNGRGVVAESDPGLSFVAAGAFELLQSNHFALDLNLRFGTTAYPNDLTVQSAALSVGFSWY